MYLSVLLSILILPTSGCCSETTSPYDSDGPFSHYSNSTTIHLSSSTGCEGRSCSVCVVLTCPATTSRTRKLTTDKRWFPVVVMFNGFQLRTAFYGHYARRLASWGYVVVQYQAAVADILADTTELKFLPAVLAAAQGGGVPGADFSRIGLVGHSRGGKLTALHLTGAHSKFKFTTAFLMDPVDSYTPPGDAYPSAVEALRGRGLVLGIVGAGVVGRCNPWGRNSSSFLAAAGPGSWFMLLPTAGHMQFIQASPWIEEPLDALCGKGPIAHQEVARLTQMLMVSWMEGHLRGVRLPVDPDSPFCAWIREQSAAGEAQFSVTGQPGCHPAGTGAVQTEIPPALGIS